LHKMRNITTGIVANTSNHLQPSVGMTTSETITINVDPSAQKKARHKMMYDLTLMGRNSISRVYIVGTPPIPKPTKHRKAIIHR